MVSRATAICLSSDSDSEDLAKSARKEAARHAAAAKEQKLRDEAYQRDVAAALAVGTGPEAVKKPAVSDAQMALLVSAYRKHFGDYCEDRAKRNKYLTQYFPYVVWEKVYEDFKAKFPDARLEQSVLKTCMRAGLRDSKYRQTAGPRVARPAPVAPPVTTARSPLVDDFRVPRSFSSMSALNPYARPPAVVVPAAATATAVHAAVPRASLSSGTANPQAPSEPQAQLIDPGASHNQSAVVAEESRQSALQEQYDRDLKRRVRENELKLKELKKQKLVLENLKLARELEVMSHTECVEEGGFIVEKWKQQRDAVGSV